MTLEELGAMPEEERMIWITSVAKVQDLNAILKEVGMKYSKLKKQEKIELVKELVAQEIRISGILKIEGLKIEGMYLDEFTFEKKQSVTLINFYILINYPNNRNKK